MVRTYAKRKNVASDCAWRENVSQHTLCSVIGKFSEISYNIKTLREDRTAAEWDMSLMRPSAGGESCAAGFFAPVRDGRFGGK